MPAPARLDRGDQLQRALRKANRIRSSRAKLKKALAAGERDPLTILHETPSYAEGMRVGVFLMAIRGVGKASIPRLLRRSGISHDSVQLGKLTQRQRDGLSRLLRGE